MINFPENWYFGILIESRNLPEKLVFREVDLIATFGRITRIAMPDFGGTRILGLIY